MSRFPESFIEKVREMTNIVEIISPFTELKRSGQAGFMGLCPFPDHRERTASFSVNEARQIYHCFGCKKGGNVYTFLRDFQGMSFPEAVEYLAERASIALPAPEKPEQKTKEEAAKAERSLIHRLNKLAGHFYHQQLLAQPEDHPIKEYLKKRGLTAATIEQFRLGYASAEWSSLSDYFNSKRAPLSLAEKVSLIRAKNGQRGHYDFFRDRLMFPIVSVSGEVLGFGGRVLSNEHPKYLNSTDSPVFHKGRVLYGLNHSAKFIRAADCAIVVEGYMDYLALFQAGIHNVVAPLGTALTVDHARLLKRYTKNIIVLFDGDTAGMDAADRSLPILLNEEMYVRGLTLPDQLDPDEFIQEKGVGALGKALDRADDLFRITFDRLVKPEVRDIPSERVKVVDAVQPLWASVRDRRLRELYLDHMSEKLGVERPWLSRALSSTGTPMQNLHRNHVNSTDTNKFPSEKLNQNHANADALRSNLRGGDGQLESLSSKPQPQIHVGKVLKEEMWLLNLALSDRMYLELILQEKILECLSSIAVRQIFERISEVYGHAPEKFDNLSSLLASEVDDPSVVTQHLNKKLFELSEDAGKRLLADCIRKIRERENRRRSKALAGELKEPDAERLEQFKKILEDRNSLAKGGGK